MSEPGGIPIGASLVTLVTLERPTAGTLAIKGAEAQPERTADDRLRERDELLLRTLRLLERTTYVHAPVLIADIRRVLGRTT